MKPILIHIHIFYPELWNELKVCINNIYPYKFDLFITLVEHHKDIINDIKENFPFANIEIVENKGYDIGPFIYILNKINLDNYSYIVKLHTKHNIPYNTNIGNGYIFKNDQWRKALLSFLKDKKTFNNCIKSFDKDKKLGMIANYKTILKKEKRDKKAEKEAYKLLQQINLRTNKYQFVAGTMFICLSPYKK